MDEQESKRWSIVSLTFVIGAVLLAVAAIVYAIQQDDTKPDYAPQNICPSCPDYVQAPPHINQQVAATNYGNVYTKAVTPANQDLARLRTELESANFEAVINTAIASADSQRKFMDTLIRTDWPDNVQADIDKLVPDVAMYISNLRAISQANTLEEVNEVWEYGNWPGNSQAQIVRAKLGLGTA